MTLSNGESIWKLSLGILVLVFFFCIGVAHVVAPDRFIKKSAVRKGGEMLTDFNRIGFQIMGIIAMVFSGRLVYMLVEDLISK